MITARERAAAFDAGGGFVRVGVLANTVPVHVTALVLELPGVVCRVHDVEVSLDVLEQVGREQALPLLGRRVPAGARRGSVSFFVFFLAEV